MAKLIIAKTANDTVADAKRRAPVDTGALRDSIDWTPYNDGLGAEIGSTVDYAPYQEFGTWKMAPQPFLNPAADKYFPRAEKAFQALLNRLV
jgi:HK97 gp10 family phage protein